LVLLDALAPLTTKAVEKSFPLEIILGQLSFNLYEVTASSLKEKSL
jgi:hypothetical protein